MNSEKALWILKNVLTNELEKLRKSITKEQIKDQQPSKIFANDGALLTQKIEFFRGEVLAVTGTLAFLDSLINGKEPIIYQKLTIKDIKNNLTKPEVKK